ncbi:MAG: hypothetical protein RI932_300 [Pseudomonadota bacterium]|jgi:hypothetical protein
MTNKSRTHFKDILIVSTLTWAGLLTACTSRVNSDVREFKSFGTVKQESVTIQLPNLQRALKAAGLPAAKINAVRQTLESETRLDSQRTHLAISLGTLSREQCEIARMTYADGWKQNLSGVDCASADGQKDFLLDDFLTPVMQATLRHTFIPEKAESSRTLTPDERKQYGISAGGEVLVSKSAETNCWSTAYEVLRRSSGPTPIYTVHNLMPHEVDLRLTNSQLSKSILSDVPSAELKTKLLAAGVSFGDFIIVRDKPMAMEAGSESDVVHVTIQIDEGLVFERVGTDSVFPMRIAKLDDVVADYSRAKYDVRRSIKDFPDPKTENFKRHVTQSMEGVVYDVTIELKDYTLSKGKNGRFSLPADAYGRRAGQ